LSKLKLEDRQKLADRSPKWK